MRIKALLILCFLFFIKPVLAGDPPILMSPSNDSIVISSKLEWQIPTYSLYSGGSPYMIQVDDQQSFANPEKNNIYLKNNYYTPQLNPGVWHWRVKAKDINGTWSDWSLTWLFTLQTSTPSPTPTSTSQPTPTFTSTPTPTSTPQSTSLFVISSSQTQINSDQSINITVDLSLSNKPNTKFYLKGAFRKPGSTNYFGFTKVGNNWIKNSSTYSDQHPITTDQSGNWTGNLEIKADAEDTGYTGSDDYSLKIGRYDSTDSSPSVVWASNELTIKIIAVSSQSTNATTITPTPTVNLSTTPIPSTAATTSTRNKIASVSQTPKTYQNATVAGIKTTANKSASPSSYLNNKKGGGLNPFIFTGSIFILIGISTVGYIYLKKNANIHFKIR